MIKIKKSLTADSRTSNFKNVTKEVLLESTEQHMKDVAKALLFFVGMLEKAALTHDDHKLQTIDEFHKTFTGGFDDKTWWKEHQKERHHIKPNDPIQEDINLVDVLEYISDCVMAGMGRSGEVTDVIIEPETLMKAFKNSVQLLIDNVEVEED